MELFWDWVKSSFALEPGEFADLLSGVGTLLAFVLGLVILFQDRQRQARIQAGRFVAYAEALDDWNGFDIVERHLIIRMTNTNDVPMHLVSVMTSQKSQEFINLVVRDESLDKDSLVEKGVAFKPGENWVKRFTVSGPILREHLVVSFVDGAGKQWMRDLRSQKFLSARKQRMIIEFARNMQANPAVDYRKIGKNLA
ncbi:hypothetical protein GTU73_09480 [Rathayibacter sp. VKM Ac-2804]|uniref:hypothetical protein n=1 Tax=Rathayibacter sp. VKM Ac-2804 TaxID=2609257 RepID=UPI00132EAA9E|nr:hypothetical protein [Rathayibacter sp. VKM Ac-2804]QHF24219.1 hypothetical protein GTU73_09480 [Rathayibacter sp. VKM Ac-2804]